MNMNYQGRPIVPENAGNRDAPDSVSYTHLRAHETAGHRAAPDSTKSRPGLFPGVDELAEWMNRVTGGTPARAGMIDVSPATIEYLMLFTLGGFGRTVKGVLTESKLGAKAQPNERPVMRFLDRDPTGGLSGVQRRYYELADETETAKRTIDAVRSGSMTEAERAADQARNPDGYAMLAQVRAAESRLGELRAARRRADDARQRRVIEEEIARVQKQVLRKAVEYRTKEAQRAAN